MKDLLIDQRVFYFDISDMCYLKRTIHLREKVNYFQTPEEQKPLLQQTVFLEGYLNMASSLIISSHIN